jgi:tetratricopeptide (TPR) repeat protein
MPYVLPDISTIWDFDDLDKSEQRLRGLVPVAEEAGNLSYRLQLLTQIARVYSLRADFEMAHGMLDTIEPYMHHDPAVEVRYLLERARCYHAKGQSQKAYRLFIQAWGIAKAARLDFLAVDAAHMVAIVEPDPQKQINWHKKAIAVTENSTQPYVDTWFGSLYNNLGWTYHDIGDYQHAHELFLKAMEWREKQDDPKRLRIARWLVARSLRSLERYEEALAMQQALREEFDEAGESGPFNYEELGECLLAIGYKNEAKNYFAKAYELLKEMNWIESDRLARIKALAEIG